ncbi:efflux RND transporter permease subunit [Persicirhabdus sediminis]|uniref:Efflux RND transporter permease subunit n=1 Tax=Persicirhabdus sediminis TaxID=454144 RepID=A0A8J7MG49_9BACT|nr:efflux RND transporter permease subunit [Persicirhabdus sediminis]MBK1792202.1 efflux RND transporter permease subunit [Persicirhabdus sediminis]
MIRWFAQNSYAANFLLIAVILLGAYTAYFKTPVEVSPSYDIPVVRINVPMPGAAPTEVEDKVIIPIENALKGIDNVKHIDAQALRGVGRVWVRADDGADLQQLKIDVESALTGISTFPAEAENPNVFTPNTSMWAQVITVAVYGQLNEGDLLKAARQVRDELMTLPGVSNVIVTGQQQNELSIEVSQHTLEKYGLTLSTIARAVRESSIDMSAGSISSSGSRLLLRSSSQAYVREDFEKIIISREGGAELRLGDIARIVDGFDDQMKDVRFNGEPCLLVEVKRRSNENALKISDQVHNYVANAGSTMPDGIKLAAWNDDSVSLRGQISILMRNMMQGSILVILFLGLFLRPSLAFWIVVGIPVSVAGGLIFMPLLNVSINVMSLFGFIIVLGIVVDDAIVTGENIFSKLKQGYDPLEAAVEGTTEVARPVTFGVATTMVAFLPLLFIPGWWGTFAKQIPVVVIPVLLFSLIESKFILPCHLKHVKVNRKGLGAVEKVQKACTDSIMWLVDKIYRPVLHSAVSFRYLTLALFIALAMSTLGYWQSGKMGFVSMPDVDRYYIFARLQMEDGTTFEQTHEQVQRIAAAVEEIKPQFMDPGLNESLLGNVLTATGGWPSWGNVQDERGFVLVEIIPPSKRTVRGANNSDIAEAWTKAVGEIPGVRNFIIRAQDTGKSGSDEENSIELKLLGNDTGAIEAISEDIVSMLEEREGISQAGHDIREPQDEFQILLRPEGRELGLTQQDLARQVRNAFHGDQAQRIQRGEDNIRVMVRLPKTERESLHTLDSLRIMLDNGSSVAIGSVAEIIRGKSPPHIKRHKGARVTSIFANPESKEVDIIAMSKELPAEIDEIIKSHGGGATWTYSGFLAENEETRMRMLVGGIAMFFTIYALLAIPFNSMLQPIFVMLAVPFGLIGAIGGHIIMDITPSYLSMFGMLALAGVVVNDSLVMVDFANKRRKEGATAYNAVIESGAARFRPIVLTSLTTFAGLMPLIFEQAIQAQFLIPMAVSLGFGILFATLITLFLIPCSYLAMDDLVAVMKRMKDWYFKPFGNKDKSA